MPIERPSNISAFDSDQQRVVEDLYRQIGQLTDEDLVERQVTRIISDSGGGGASATTLAELNDTTILAPSAFDVLTYNGVEWINVDSPQFVDLTLTNSLTINGTQLFTVGEEQPLGTGDTPVFAAIDTGQGAHELYAMDQDVQTSDAVTFAGATFNGNVTLESGYLWTKAGISYLSGGAIVGSSAVPTYDFEVDGNSHFKTGWVRIQDDFLEVDDRLGIGNAPYGPNRIGNNELQVDGSVDVTGSIGFISDASTQQSSWRLFQGGSIPLLIMKNFDANFGVADIRGLGVDVSDGGIDSEATLTLYRGNDAETDSEFIDYYNNGYSTSREYGVNIQKRGVGSWRRYLFGFDDGTTYTNYYTVSPPDANNNIDFEVDIIINGALDANTVNTGQGDNELYAMNQNVRTSDAVTFATVDTGQGANELYAMNQDVQTSDTVEFAELLVNISSFSASEKARVNGDMRIDGGLDVAGTINYLNETNLDVEDKIITVNVNGTDASSEGAGLTVERPSGDQSILWTTADGFSFSDGVTVGGHILPDTNFAYDIGTDSERFRTLHVAELFVELLTVSERRSTTGGRFNVGLATVLTSDLAAGGTSIDVENNNLNSGDIIHLEKIGQIEFMEVTSAASGTGPYSYDVTRNLDGSGANNWASGDGVFNTGSNGTGFIDLYAINAIDTSISTSGPTIAFMERTGSNFNDLEIRAGVGNLDGWYGYSGDTFGFAAGDPSGENVTVDPTNGIRIRAGTDVAAELSGTQFRLGDASNHVDFDASSGVAEILFDTFTLNAGSGNLSIDSAAQLISIQDATFGNTGIQLDYNGGTPRFFAGVNGGNFIEHDGTTLTFTADNTSLDASGNLTATNVDLTGTISADAGDIAGWTIAPSNLTSPSGSSAEFRLQDATETRLKIGSESTLPTTVDTSFNDTSNSGVTVSFAGADTQSGTTAAWDTSDGSGGTLDFDRQIEVSYDIVDNSTSGIPEWTVVIQGDTGGGTWEDVQGTEESGYGDQTLTQFVTMADYSAGRIKLTVEARKPGDDSDVSTNYNSIKQYFVETVINKFGIFSRLAPNRVVALGDATSGSQLVVPVNSVFGREGDVVAQSGDYDFSQISGTATTGQLPSTVMLEGENVSLLNNDAGYITSVFGRGGDVVAQSGDYDFSQISGTATTGQLPSTVMLEGEDISLLNNDAGYITNGVQEDTDVQFTDVSATSAGSSTLGSVSPFASLAVTNDVTINGTSVFNDAGGGLTQSGNTVSHADTSTEGNANLGSFDAIDEIQLDGYGHVTSITSKDLSGVFAPLGTLAVFTADVHIESASPFLWLYGSSTNQAESGRIRLTESGSLYQGGYLHYDGSTNVFYLGVHDASDTDSANDVTAFNIPRATAVVNFAFTPNVSGTDVALTSDLYTDSDAKLAVTGNSGWSSGNFNNSNWDTAYNQRGAAIAGTGLNWTGSDLELSGDSFDSSGTYANLRAQATTIGDVGGVASTGGTFTGNVTFPTIELDNKEFNDGDVGGISGGQLIYDASVGLALYYGSSGSGVTKGISVIADRNGTNWGSNLAVSGGQGADSNLSIDIVSSPTFSGTVTASTIDTTTLISDDLSLGYSFNQLSYDSSVDIDNLDTTGEFRFLNSPTNAPTSGRFYYFGAGGGDTAGRGVQLVWDDTDGMWYRNDVPNNPWQKVATTGELYTDAAAKSAVTGNATWDSSNFNNGNWDTAYGWGDHAAVGYYQSGDSATLQNLDIDNVLRMVSTNTAYQRADSRDDATTEARLHWYGKNDSGGTVNFKHAYYDGSAYIDVTASGGTLTFTGDITADNATLTSLNINRFTVDSAGIPEIDLAGSRLVLEGDSGTDRDWAYWNHTGTRIWTGWIDANDDFRFNNDSGAGTFIVNSALSLDGPVSITNDGNGVLRLARGSGNASILPYSGEGWLIMDGNGSGCALNYYDGSNVILANGGGLVAVGHTSPGANLDVSGTAIISSTLFVGKIDTQSNSPAIETNYGVTFWYQGDHAADNHNGELIEQRFSSGSGVGDFIRFRACGSGDNTAQFNIVDNHISLTDVLDDPGSGDEVWSVDNNGDVRASDFILSSDARLKSHAQPITDPLGRISEISAYEYIKREQWEIGVMAQDVAARNPRAVREMRNGYLGLTSNAMSSLAIGAINQLRAKVEQLEAKLARYE